MLRVIGCFTQEHNFLLTMAAAVVCMLGSGLSIRLFMRARRARRSLRRIHIGLTSMIAGATVWATHFIAMLAYDPVVEHGYEPVITGASLLVAIAGSAISFSIAAEARSNWASVRGGATLGLTIVAMHYLGMSAYLIPGRIIWNPQLVMASIILGVVFGGLAFHRVLQPLTPYCWLGGVLAMFLAVCLMHFTGMGAISIELDPTIVVPPQVISDTVLGFLVLSLVSLFLMLGLATFLIDVNMTEQTSSLLKDAALRDPLTGLPNRLSLEQVLADIRQGLQEGEDFPVAMLTIDLDLFKEINDLHGHAAGDCVLRAIAARFEEVLDSPFEFVARTGGDEFIALKRRYTRIEDVRAFAESLRARILEPVPFNDIMLNVGASVGFAIYPDDRQSLDELQHYSDLAMYRAKADPHEKICRFDAYMDQQSRERITLLGDLRQALSRDEFQLCYQLQNDVDTHAVVGFEVLLRWLHPERGFISPEKFVPIAESSGLIREIGLWVLRTACFEAASWPNPYRVAVNISPQQLIQPSFVESVSDILIESRLDPEQLELEVTEASIIDDQHNTLKVMHRLKTMGIRIAMDDFGTGYSSLSTLQAFPFDKIKIDRSFITDVHKDEQRAAIVRSTMLLGAALQIPVLAEGVEQADELEFLKRQRCDEVQGFFFGRPMSVADARQIASQPLVGKNCPVPISAASSIRH